MNTFMAVLHVTTAVLTVGPAMLTPWLGDRALRDRDGRAVHLWGRRTMLFNALTLVPAVFGILATSTSEEFSFADPWLVISSTVYVIALVNGAALIPMTLARIGKDLLDEGGLDAELLEKHRGRLLALAWLNVVFYTVVIVLMAWRP